MAASMKDPVSAWETGHRRQVMGDNPNCSTLIKSVNQSWRDGVGLFRQGGAFLFQAKGLIEGLILNGDGAILRDEFHPEAIAEGGEG